MVREKGQRSEIFILGYLPNLSLRLHSGVSHRG